MRRGTSVSFWKNYENQQMRLVTSCMPKTVAREIRVVVPRGCQADDGRRRSTLVNHT